jgi:hypothetical protein
MKTGMGEVTSPASRVCEPADAGGGPTVEELAAALVAPADLRELLPGTWQEVDRNDLVLTHLPYVGGEAGEGWLRFAESFGWREQTLQTGNGDVAVDAVLAGEPTGSTPRSLDLRTCCSLRSVPKHGCAGRRPQEQSVRRSWRSLLG